MNLLELSRLGAHHLRNRASEEIYLRTGLDTTVPVSIYGEVIERCNTSVDIAITGEGQITAKRCQLMNGRRPWWISKDS
jgi:hypothetical protein